jgi:hypothetical protein
MEPNHDLYYPSRLYLRVGLAAVAGTLVCALCGMRAPLALVPGILCLTTSLLLFWLGSRPTIRVSEGQLNIGDRAIAWRELREVNSSRFVSPLILHLRLTNSRRKTLIFPGSPERIARLLYQIRKLSTYASFDGVDYRDYWTWNSIQEAQGSGQVSGPVRMIRVDEEDEIESMFQKLRNPDSFESHEQDSKAPREE